MVRRFLILFIVLIYFALRCYSQNIVNDDRLRYIVSQVGQVDVTISSGDVRSLDDLTRNVSILSVKNNTVYIGLSAVTVEWFIHQKYNYIIEERADSKELPPPISTSKAFGWDSYPTYAQYDSLMQSFKKLYPSLCHLDTIGTSVNGKLVLALKISKNADIDEDKPEVFYSSTMHGDETGGFVLMLRLSDYLLKNYNLNTRVKTLVDNLEIWINPLANPDGAYKSGGIISPLTSVRFNANGVDLNRNFPDPITPNTIRQKETLDMIKFMRKHKFVLSANFHSGSEVVNYPWDRWLYKLHADDSWFNSISRSYADTAHIYGGPAYMNFLNNGVTRGGAWYLIYGGRQDFITGELHGREVTIELDDQYVTPASQLNLLWQNNWRSLLGYLENALYGIHGLVRSINSNVPVPAKVFISGHDKDNSQVYSDTLTGSFVRFLSPGSWNLTFTATGYQPLLISNVIVTAGQKTDLIVDMLPVIDSVENPNSTTLILLYPNPARNDISAILPDIMKGKINVRIISETGMLLSDYNSNTVQGIPLMIDIRSLSAGVYTVVFSDLGKGSYFHGRFVVIK